MVKHLHFNPTDFNHLILSGLMIEIYKDDIECHPSEETSQLKFVQGHNVVENTIEGILKFANADCRKKYFGFNSQQQAVIAMVNGVCKDIDAKLTTAVTQDELAQKVGYLNNFWSHSSYQWLKHKFYYCHMNILTLSFRLQQKFPDILIKYPVFVEQRRLFISDKWLSKRALVSMFANPCNMYQEFDLFPEAEGECSLRSSFGIPAQSGEEDSAVQQIEENFVEIQAVEMPDGSEFDHRKSHQKQRAEERFSEEPLHQRESSEFRNIDSEASKIKTVADDEEDRFQTLESKILDETTHHHHHNQQTRSQFKSENQSKTSEVIESNVVPQISAVIADLVSEVRDEEAALKVQETVHESSELNQRKMDSSENDDSNRMKKSLKQSFSEHFTKPLEYSTKSLAQNNDSAIKTQQTQRNEEKNHEKSEAHHEHHEEAKKVHENEKVSENHHEKDHKAVEQSVQLKKQLIIDEAESEKYVSHEQIDHNTNPVHTTKQPEKQINPQKVAPITKPPQSESISSQKGPRTDMQQAIKPREQPVQKQKESCKCEIY